MMCHVLIHPRVAIISSSFRNNITPNSTNINDFQENIEVNIGTDQPITRTCEQLKEDFSQENSEQIVEKTRNAVHRTSSYSTDNIAQASSRSSSANDKDAALSDAETQHGSLELVRNTQNNRKEITHAIVDDNENENVHEGKTITKQYDNVKRSLPEDFEESKNKLSSECSSEVFGDSISTAKRRKTQDISTKSNVEENVLNNNDRETAKTVRTELLESGEVSSWLPRLRYVVGNLKHAFTSQMKRESRLL